MNPMCQAIVVILFLAILCTGQTDKQCNKSSSKYINLEDQAIKKVAAEYPAEPGFHAKGKVVIWIAVDEKGNVVSARSICGHPLFRAASVSAAAQWKFQPKQVDGKPSTNVGVIVFDFKDVNRDRGN